VGCTVDDAVHVEIDTVEFWHDVGEIGIFATVSFAVRFTILVIFDWCTWNKSMNLFGFIVGRAMYRLIDEGVSFRQPSKKLGDTHGVCSINNSPCVHR